MLLDRIAARGVVVTGRKERQPRDARANKVDDERAGSGSPGSEARHARQRQALVVESDLPQFNAVAGWERELLLPFVNQLVEAVVDIDSSTGNVHEELEEPEERDR